MTLIPLTDEKEIKGALDTLRARLKKGCKTYTRVIGWQGGNYETEVYWNSQERFWFTQETTREGGRYWCPFGTWDPVTHQNLKITVECNPPCDGVDRRCAGAFLTDGNKIFIAHSGKIGGGREGIGKTAFVDSYPHGNWCEVRWPDGFENEMIVIGSIAGKRLPQQFSEFIREVRKFKRDIEAGEETPPSDFEPGFSPEFEGKRKKYRISGDIESSCDHGKIVNQLEKCLRKLGYNRIGKDQPRDIFLLSENNALELLFEIKPDVSTTAVYQGIGQLLYHSAVDGKAPRKIFVVPEKPKPKTQAVLDKLRIDVLTFGWNGETPVFHNLKGLLK
ncbi:MAG: hypothetical protein PCFJNLEI_03325 [Verrucomicrobiae bacterium]|nr:hypothetical protein [Verrucomicrobiae bacterium]